MNSLNTRDLVLRLQAGDLEALGVLYDDYRTLVYRTALGITGDPEVAADLLQEVFLRLYRFAHRLDPLRPLEPWLYRVTTNLAYTWAKRQKRWLRSLEYLAERVARRQEMDPSDHIIQSEDWQRVQQALLRLPIPQRVVITLFYLNDLSVQEIAELLDLPVGTVKSRLHYGRKALQKTLGQDEELLVKVQYEFT